MPGHRDLLVLGLCEGRERDDSETATDRLDGPGHCLGPCSLCPDAAGAETGRRRCAGACASPSAQGCGRAGADASPGRDPGTRADHPGARPRRWRGRWRWRWRMGRAMTRTGISVAAVVATRVAATAPVGAQTASGAGSTDFVPLQSLKIDTSVPPRRKYAIVIGNGDYAAIPDLRNAVADAEDVAAFLRAQGYEVRLRTNVTKRGFEEVLRRALFDVTRETEVVFFFAGHGFQIGAENFLVPVDSDIDAPDDVPFEAVSLGSLVSIIGARARAQVIILDSCRNNPFAGMKLHTSVGKELRETETGFASLAAPVNSILVYSTSPGAVALDGEGENSPFTTALIEVAAEAPSAPAKDVFETVRRIVYERTEGRQVPWDSSTLVEPISLGLGPQRPAPEQSAPATGGDSRGLVI